MAKSKFFRAFVAGNTISDGRTITPEMISDIVATFNADTYTPRCNVEHISGYSPEPPFNGYGDVIAVKEQDDEFTIAGKTEKRRALYCQVEGNDQLIALAARDQKPFCSVEITENYAGTGKVGLVGLAFTDTPASIGTQRLKFSRVANTKFATGEDKAWPEFEVPAVGSAAGFFAEATAFFKNFGKAPEAPIPPVVPPVGGGGGSTTPTAANDNDPRFGAIVEGIGKLTAGMERLGSEVRAEIATVRGEQANFKAQVEATQRSGSFNRQTASGAGGKAEVLTDC